MDPAQPLPRTSGIPKPSATRLPVPKTRTSHGGNNPPLAQPTPASTLIVQPQAPARTVATSVSSAGFVRPQKQTPSASSTFRPPPPPVRSSSATGKPGSIRPNLANAQKPPAKPSTASGTSLANRSTLTKRPASSARGRVAADEDEIDDQLTSLDSFRSASRQGGHDDDEHQEVLEFVDPNSVMGNPQPTKAARPSLSDRTIESLQMVPTTPKDRRRSSFFNPVESPMGPPPRLPLCSNASRPGTSDGTVPKTFANSTSPAKKVSTSAKPASRISTNRSNIGTFGSANVRSISGGLTSRLQEAKTATSRSTSPAKSSHSKPSGLPAGQTPKAPFGIKPTGSSQPGQARPLGSAFTPTKPRPTAGAKAAANPQEGKRLVTNSSSALRQQIAAAKAAARKEKEQADFLPKHDSPTDIASAGNVDNTFDFDMSADPFNQGPKDEKHVLKNRINNARMDGKLNIAAMGLKDIPDEVLTMYGAAAMEAGKVNWAEVVDLTKFIVADNEIEAIDDRVFPDVSADDIASDDQADGNQFGGLEMLDLHGNLLSGLPTGLRRLERLTSLNLTHNKLDNTVFEVIRQITTLKELRLGHNNLTSNLPSSVCELKDLERLDVQSNRLLGLPEALRDLVGLRVLNVSGNQLTALPMEALEQLPLVELDASSNALIASLFPLGGPDGHQTLRSLDVANNSLAALTFSERLSLPQLTTLSVANNQLTALPSVEGWSKLITLHAGDNKLSDFPHGFTSLLKLRNASFNSNEIRLLDPEISKLESLETLVLAANPLRERKFLTMNAADIKRDLRSRLLPELDEPSRDEDEPGSPITVVGGDTGSMWSLRANGLLDLSSKNLSDDLNDILGSCLQGNEVKQIHLQNNKISCIPPALWIAQDLRVLDLSGNTMDPNYLSDELLLPALVELNLSKCRIASLKPLIDQLQAPVLQALNVNANRLTGSLPTLRTAYPRLTTLFANDNKIRSISVDSLRGFQTVQIASNDIDSLPAEVGLLWDDGLRHLDVASNAFRVPNYRILDKGTEAVLRWLRDRIPKEIRDGARQGAVEGWVDDDVD